LNAGYRQQVSSGSGSGSGTAFGAAEAAEIYYFYYLHGTIPPQYDLRPL
jgi:hypothetical protein